MLAPTLVFCASPILNVLFATENIGCRTSSLEQRLEISAWNYPDGIIRIIQTAITNYPDSHNTIFCRTNYQDSHNSAFHKRPFRAE
jgi:hypothetical protein